MFTLIPFKNLSDIKSLCSLDTIYESCIESGKVYIQDMDDMVIEKYTVEELREIERNYDIELYGFTLLDEWEDYDIYLGEMTVGLDSYLNGRFKISCNSKELYIDIFDNLFEDEKPYSCYDEVEVTYKGKSFTLGIASYVWLNLDKNIILLFINGSMVGFLNDVILSDELDDDNLYLDIVQGCKTKEGFDIVISFSGSNGYLCIRLRDDLSLIRFVNLDCFKDKRFSHIDIKNFSRELAKRKLLNYWDDFKDILME